MNSHQPVPIDVVRLLPVVDKKLIDLLKSLTPDEWHRQTIAKRWKVKDVAGHLLDGNIRILSILRDQYHGEQFRGASYQDLVNFLNDLNADWVKAMQRVSPKMLILLHECTGKLYCDYYATLDPFDTSGFSVDWAGESESKNWMHIAREYTEKWLHQQQIRDAVNKPGLMTREFYYPFIDIFMLALPHTYRDVKGENGTTIKMTINGELGGSWYLNWIEDRWKLDKSIRENPSAEITLDPDDAWKLFSKSKRPDDLRNRITITGNPRLGEIALSMVSVMA